jgi:hypothetical protein
MNQTWGWSSAGFLAKCDKLLVRDRIHGDGWSARGNATPYGGAWIMLLHLLLRSMHLRRKREKRLATNTNLFMSWGLVAVREYQSIYHLYHNSLWYRCFGGLNWIPVAVLSWTNTFGCPFSVNQTTLYCQQFSDDTLYCQLFQNIYTFFKLFF